MTVWKEEARAEESKIEVNQNSNEKEILKIVKNRQCDENNLKMLERNLEFRSQEMVHVLLWMMLTWQPKLFS